MVTSSTATIGWTEPSPAASDGYEYYYSTSNSPPTSSTSASGIVLAGTSEAGLSSLTAFTTYYFWVRSNCGTELSDWSAIGSFTTLCEVGSIPFSEGFEGGGFTQGSATFNCWTQESSSGTAMWYSNTSLTSYNRTPRSGSWNTYLRYGNTDWLFYPVSLTSGTEYLFEVYARQDGSTSSNASITLGYATSANGDAMTTVGSATGLVNGDYQQISGTFTPSSTGTFYIGILGTINNSPWYISLDDISLTVAQCPLLRLLHLPLFVKAAQ